MYNTIKYIYWAKEAKYIKLTVDEMKAKIDAIRHERVKAKSNTKRIDFTTSTYKIDAHGDYYSLYLYEDGEYRVYSTNGFDNTKNKTAPVAENRLRAEKVFEDKFREENGLTLRRAFGFVDKTLKRCIPKQFYYIDKKYIGKILLASSIDASSQYASGLLGRLPDMHKAIRVSGTVKPSAEYPFAFYASGHCAEYGVFDTHDWITSKYFNYLFRLEEDEYCFRTLKPEEDETILMQASDYELTNTWNYFYNIKSSFAKDSEEYNQAKLVMNRTIGCWHRKDKDKKGIMTYDDHGSYQLAHLVAIAIGRGNQKILNKIAEIGDIRVIHVCVDGIIYMGYDKQGIDNTEFGVFAQEFTGCRFKMNGINAYAAEDMRTLLPVKFKHGGYDLIYGKDIDESVKYGIKDLDYLSQKQTIGEFIKWEDQREAEIAE